MRDVEATRGSVDFPGVLKSAKMVNSDPGSRTEGGFKRVVGARQ